jgi:transcriptional regulator with XRE-family HTH domain
MSTNFFQDALRNAMNTRHFNQAQLAEFLKVDPAYVSRWLKGSSPRLDQMRNVLTTLGWDIMRARPDYDAFEDALSQLSGEGAPAGVKEKGKSYQNMKDIKGLLTDAADKHKRASLPPVVQVGTMKAADGRIEFADSSKSSTFDGFTPLLGKVDYAANELGFVVVQGNEMSALYPAGTRLFVRKVLKPQGVPDGAQVIMEGLDEPGIFLLRRLMRAHDKREARTDRLIGAPLVPTQSFLFFRTREVRLHSVVVAALQDLALR